ncbi:MAG: 30S ribosomal protein S1 [Phycisphaerales bacterium]
MSADDTTNPPASSPTADQGVPSTTNAAPPGPEPAAAAPEQAAAPAAPAPSAMDPMKGLPKITKAQVVGSEGTEQPYQGRPGGGGGGKFGGPRRDKPSEAPEKVPDTRKTLHSVSDESRDAGSAGSMTAEMEAEIAAAMASGELMPADLPPAHHNKPVISHKPGEPGRIRGPRVVEGGREKRHGTIVSVGPSDIFLEFGPKELGVLPRVQYKEGEEVPAAGTTIEVVVDRFDTTESLFLCSRPTAVQKAKWELLEIGQVVEARVTGVNKGGLDLEVAGHRAFMPAGQVSLDRIPDLSIFIGEKFTCTIVQVDTRGKGNIVLSRRDMLKVEREEKAKKIKETLQEGQTVEGTVRKLMPFGAFVDIGGIDGLIHISDLSYDRVLPGEKHIAKHVNEGDVVNVKVLKIDWEANKISLGLKQLASDPFAVATGAIAIGSDVSGTVVRLTEFGAFVNIAPGVDALLHVSEISRKRINAPGDVLKQDQVITARIIKIEADTRRISLSMRALEKAPEADPNDPRAKMRADREKQAAERLAEIAKETPQLRKQREKFRNKELTGGFGKKAKFLGGGLGDLKLGS